MGAFCLLGAIVFGTFAVLLIKVIHPLISSYINPIPHTLMHYTSIALLVLMLEDGIYSAMSFSTFSRKVRGLAIGLAGSARRASQAVNPFKETTKENNRRNPAIDKLKTFIKRMKAGK